MPTKKFIHHLFSTATLPASPSPAAPPAIITMDQRATLLSIPPELRLQIYDCMSLWPGPQNSPLWLGAYYTCRTMQSEMQAHVHFVNDNASNLDRLQSLQTNRLTFTISPVVSDLSPCLLQGITLTLPVQWDDMYPRSILGPIYELYLDYITIILQRNKELTAVRNFPPYGDLKSLKKEAFMDFVTKGKVNCKRATISIQHLANAEGGRKTSTDLEIIERNIPYTLTIVQDTRGHQTEKTFSSPWRFRPVTHDQLAERRMRINPKSECV